MLQPIQRMPTLGYFHKMVCDCLGLWASDNKDIIFNVPATEKERRKALSDAFDAIQRDDGSYGNHDDLISITTKIAPEQEQAVKKNKTIQAYSNELAKTDFSSYHELIEVRAYIDTVIGEKFPQKCISDFASKFYFSSIMHYREFIREHSSGSGDQSSSYQYFINHILVSLTESIAEETAKGANFSSAVAKSDELPLKSFIDSVANLCDVSLYKLCQFHEMKLNSNSCDTEIWSGDFKSKPINTKSKQAIERIGKKSKIKWDTLYPVIKPLIHHLPDGIEEDMFATKAYSALLAHNLLNQTTGSDFGELRNQERDRPSFRGISVYLPASDRIDSLLNNDETPDEMALKTSIEIYRDSIRRVSLLRASLNGDVEIPSTFDFLYDERYAGFQIEAWSKNLNTIPLWINEWISAEDAISAGDSSLAAHHFKRSLDGAKYIAGPLFTPLYIQLCAFCKSQYKELKKRNEEHLFDKFYESLGGDATAYATLLGYTPGFSRDPKTLLPKSLMPKKNGLIIHKIDSMIGLFSQV